MARAPLQRIAEAGSPGQPSLNRRLRRWLAREMPTLRQQIELAAGRFDTDRYRKHFDAFAHACLLLFHGLSGGQSLRQSYAAFPHCRGLVEYSHLAASPDPDDEGLAVSFSQFADSNSTRPAAFLGGIVPYLASRVRQLGRGGQAAPPPELHILDSTFLGVSLLLAPWVPSTGRADVPGVRVQLQYAPALDLPEHVLVSDTRVSDQRGLDQLILDDPSHLAELRGQTLVLDLGYYSHRRFRRLVAAGVHLVSRLHPQARVEVEAEVPIQQPLPSLPAGRIAVLADQQAGLGSQDNQIGHLRVVTAVVEPLPKAARRGARPVTYRLITDRFDLSGTEVVQLYLWRWQIELFLRWLKSHVHLPRLLGYSRNAIELTVWLAIVVHLLTLLAAASIGLSRRSPGLLAQMIWALVKAVPADCPGPAGEPCQLTLPLWQPGNLEPT